MNKIELNLKSHFHVYTYEYILKIDNSFKNISELTYLYL